MSFDQMPINQMSLCQVSVIHQMCLCQVSAIHQMCLYQVSVLPTVDQMVRRLNCFRANDVEPSDVGIKKL